MAQDSPEMIDDSELTDTDWVNETPEGDTDTTYELIMWEDNHMSAETVSMTREEYIALKGHLAAIRGIRLTDIAARFDDLCANVPDGYNENPDQVARHLETARDFYRIVPDLVVFESAYLDGFVEGLAR